MAKFTVKEPTTATHGKPHYPLYQCRSCRADGREVYYSASTGDGKPALGRPDCPRDPHCDWALL